MSKYKLIKKNHAEYAPLVFRAVDKKIIYETLLTSWRSVNGLPVENAHEAKNREWLNAELGGEA